MKTNQLIDFCNYCLNKLQNPKSPLDTFICHIVDQWVILHRLTQDERKEVLTTLMKHLCENITLTSREDLKHNNYFLSWNTWFSSHKERIAFIEHFKEHLLTPIENEPTRKADF